MANFHHLCCGLLIFGSCSFVPVDSTVSELPVPSAEETATNLSTRALDTPPLGAYQLPISGATEEAQRWFNQGLLYLYGFNHDAAAACFSRAATLSPDSAMTWWGMAHALNLDINQFEISEQESAYAVSAIRKAEQLALSRQLTDLERILIQAESARTVHPAPPLHERGPLDKAYSKILENAWSKHPGEADLGCLFAESLMILQPWAYWTPDKEPVKRALDIVHTLESVIALDSQHPGANHFYIHAMESSATPEKAEAAADRLGNLAPRAGHLVHMPSHIYINVGRYEDAVNVNVQAAELDKAYLKEYSENTFYHNYYVHNLHFVAYAAMMEGRKSLALEFIERMESETSEAVIKKFAANVDGLLATRLHIYIRFGLWEDILAVPDYADYRKASIALRHYARTVALANLGRTQEAREELDLFGAATLECPEEWMIAYNPCRDVLALAKEVALGEVYWNEGNTALAIHHLKEATKQEHVLVYTEPPAWMVPVRHALGAILLASGDALAAEMTYREDLSKHRENAWSLLGLSQALKKQGKHTEAEIVNVRFEKAWERSDITATSSCYCVKPQS